MTEKKALKCEQCGAPLDPRGATEWVECTYCGCVHDLAPDQAPQRPSVHTPPQGAAAPLWMGLGVVLVVALIGGIIAVVAYTQVRSGALFPRIGRTRVEPHARPAPLPSRPAGPEPVDWRTNGTCPVDADGDGIGDVASMAWSSGHQDRITVVSGKDGRILWQSRSLKQNIPFYCLSREWIAVEHPGFRLELHHVRRPQKAVTVTLRDKLDAVAAGTGCVRLKTADGRVTGLRLPQGTTGPCRAGKLRRARLLHHGVIERSDRRGAVTRDGVRYEVRMRRQGTPMLTVEARRRGRRIWTRDLPLSASRYGTALALVGNRLVVFGVRPQRETQGVLLALDPASGAQAYARDLRHQSSQALAYFEYNGRYVVLAAWVGLHAFDPATGERAWHIGR